MVSEAKRFNYSSVRSVDRTLDILEYLSGNRACSLAEISRGVSLHKSTVFNILTTLMKRGYVEQNEDNSHYQLTLRLLKLGHQEIDQRSLLEEAAPYLRKLRRETGDEAHLVVVDGGQFAVVDDSLKRSGAGVNGDLHSHLREGARKLFLASLPENLIRQLLEEQDWIKHFSYSEIYELIRIVRIQGYVIDDFFGDLQVRSVMAPLRNHERDVVGALSISAPVEQMRMERVLELGDKVRACGMMISGQMGYLNGGGACL